MAVSLPERPNIEAAITEENDMILKCFITPLVRHIFNHFGNAISFRNIFHSNYQIIV